VYRAISSSCVDLKKTCKKQNVRSSIKHTDKDVLNEIHHSHTLGDVTIQNMLITLILTLEMHHLHQVEGTVSSS
jgi:hypothetical protein